MASKVIMGIVSLLVSSKGAKNGKVPVVIINELDLDESHMASTHTLLVRHCHMITIKLNRG